jgi:hypothetical protein
VLLGVDERMTPAAQLDADVRHVVDVGGSSGSAMNCAPAGGAPLSCTGSLSRSCSRKACTMLAFRPWA